MPTYVLICDYCDNTEELFLGLTEPLPQNCPKCKQEGYRQDYSAYTEQVGVCYGWEHANTIGQVAALNEKRVGKEKLAEMSEQYKDARKRGDRELGVLPKGVTRVDTSDDGEVPFYRSGKKPLDLKKVKDVKKYILEGKK